MPRDIEELLEEWRQGDGPRIVQAGALKRVAAEFDRLRAEVVELRAALVADIKSGAASDGR